MTCGLSRCLMSMIATSYCFALPFRKLDGAPRHCNVTCRRAPAAPRTWAYTDTPRARICTPMATVSSTAARAVSCACAVLMATQRHRRSNEATAGHDHDHVVGARRGRYTFARAHGNAAGATPRIYCITLADTHETPAHPCCCRYLSSFCKWAPGRQTRRVSAWCSQQATAVHPSVANMYARAASPQAPGVR